MVRRPVAVPGAPHVNESHVCQDFQSDVVYVIEFKVVNVITSRWIRHVVPIVLTMRTSSQSISEIEYTYFVLPY